MIKNSFFIKTTLALLLVVSNMVFGQLNLKVGNNPTSISSCAVLELESTTKGLLLPRLSNTAITAMTSPINGMMVYDTDSNCIRAYENGSWSICFSNGVNGTSNGTAVITSCSLGSSSGSLIVGTAATGTQQGITVTVGTAGTYSIVTDTVNGVTFSASGTFTTTGSQTITLEASGTPTVSGTPTFTPNTTTGCSFTKTINDPSTNGTAVYTYSDCSYGSAGIMTAGNLVPDNVSQTLQVNVTTIGNYSISATSNGVTFAALGSFTETGSQTIFLDATGTPVAFGTFIYVLNTTPSCNFNRAVVANPTSNGSAVIANLACASGAGTLATNNSASSVTQTITFSVTTAGTYTIATNTVNGITFSGSGALTAGTTSLLLTATGTPTAAGTSTFVLNTTPSCSFSRTIIQGLPVGITLSAISPYFVVSINDQDYLPYTAPTGVATLTTPQAANGTNETTTLDILGSISTTGVTINIPYTATSSVALPAFSQTISIGAGYTNDNASRSLTLSYSAASLSAGSGTISATLKALGGTLNLKKLDIQTGIGSDNLGVLFGQFTYVTNSSGSTTTFELRDIALIPDRNINADANHVMFYMPITGPDGNIWLNNNLGADYANTAKAVFNPAQQATSASDYKAYGSLIQHGRNTGGHELVNWTGSAACTYSYAITATRASVITPTSNLFIVSNDGTIIPQYDWLSFLIDTPWQGVLSVNNPCPIGYRLPTTAEFTTLIASSPAISNSATAYTSGLKFTLGAGGGGRGSNSAPTSAGSIGNYWTSTKYQTGSTASGSLRLTASAATISGGAKHSGYSVRCIKD